MKQNKFHAWGINLNTDEGHGLAGRYFWFEGEPPIIPIRLEGCRASLFATRKIARENLKHVSRNVWPKAKVVKVSVILEWE
jgi:hypothetical protein